MYGADESEQFGWASGAGALYYRLAADYLYERPEDLVIFLDNHDDGRFLGQHGLDTAKLKSALQLLYSMRGIPVLYYGTELGMSGHENHGAIREDMPGFSGDFPDYTKIGGDLLSLCQELGASRAERGSTSIVQHVPEQGMYVLDLESENGSERLVVNATDREQRYERDGLSIVLKAWEARTIRMELDTHESNH
jgi:glycosidase